MLLNIAAGWDTGKAKNYRLPTEAEWEYACRAGANSVYQWGNRPEDGSGWCNAADQSAKEEFSKIVSSSALFQWFDGYTFTAPVGQFRANAFGLHDMHGSVLEFCSDWYGHDYYKTDRVSDPKGPSTLSWAARNSSKLGRGSNESWVLHATAEWSERYLEENPVIVSRKLLDMFFSATNIKAHEPTFLQAHRWRYAKTQTPLRVGCLWGSTLRIGACGDWCAASRVEGAALSGMAMAGRILELADKR